MMHDELRERAQTIVNRLFEALALKPGPTDHLVDLVLAELERLPIIVTRIAAPPVLVDAIAAGVFPPASTGAAPQMPTPYFEVTAKAWEG